MFLQLSVQVFVERYAQKIILPAHQPIPKNSQAYVKRLSIHHLKNCAMLSWCGFCLDFINQARCSEGLQTLLVSILMLCHCETVSVLGKHL
jgi:hypothetical protein